MKNLTSLLFTFSLLLFTSAVGVAQAETIYVSQTNFSKNQTLRDGNTYYFTEDVDYAAPSCESALKVADGANVVIEIAKGVTVTLTGGEASGTTGAGAGIEVPTNSTLTICGAGTLNATGGKAAGAPMPMARTVLTKRFILARAALAAYTPTGGRTTTATTWVATVAAAAAGARPETSAVVAAVSTAVAAV